MSTISGLKSSQNKALKNADKMQKLTAEFEEKMNAIQMKSAASKAQAAFFKTLAADVKSI